MTDKTIPAKVRPLTPLPPPQWVAGSGSPIDSDPKLTSEQKWDRLIDYCSRVSSRTRQHYVDGIVEGLRHKEMPMLLAWAEAQVDSLRVQFEDLHHLVCSQLAKEPVSGESAVERTAVVLQEMALARLRLEVVDRLLGGEARHWLEDFDDQWGRAFSQRFSPSLPTGQLRRFEELVREECGWWATALQRCLDFSTVDVRMEGMSRVLHWKAKGNHTSLSVYLTEPDTTALRLSVSCAGDNLWEPREGRGTGVQHFAGLPTRQEALRWLEARHNLPLLHIVWL